MTPKIIYKQQHVDKDTGRKFSAARDAHYALYIGAKIHVLRKSADKRNDGSYNATREHIANLVKYMGEREHVAKKIIDKRVRVKKGDLTTFNKESEDELLTEDEREYNETVTDERDNGLFGKIGGKFSDEYNVKDVQRYVRMMSEDRNVFHSIFSFTPQSAKEAGLETLEDWENWVKYHISEIAHGMNMKTEDIEYVAAVHLKEGQPHVHIEWWNKEQQILINVVNPLVCDAIRVAATQSTYRQQFNEIHNAEDAFVRQLRDGIAERTENILTGAALDDYTETVGKALNYLIDAVPKKGQLKYRYVPRDVKEEIDKLTHYIIDNDPRFSQLYNSALEQRRLYNELLHSTGKDASNWSKYKLSKFMGKLNDEVESYIGNAVLRIILREKKAGRRQLIEALDAAPIEEIESGRWMKYSERESFEPFIQRTKRFKYAQKAVKEERYPEALKLFTKEAETGNILAEYEIADLYRQGFIDSGGELSNAHYRKALGEFLEAEKEAGTIKPYLQYRIGRMYYDGYGTNSDYKKSVPNYEEALKWLEKAAGGGNNPAAKTVAEMYRKGLGTAPNAARAAEIYERNSEKNAWSAITLAKMLLKGDEIPKDSAKAISLLKKAKRLDEKAAPYADYTLGAAFLFDNDIRDGELAEKYLTLSAQEGNEYAQKLIDSAASQQQMNVVGLLKDVVKILSDCEQNGGNALSDAAAAVFGRGDLSREQLRELLLKKEDKENTAEM